MKNLRNSTPVDISFYSLSISNFLKIPPDGDCLESNSEALVIFDKIKLARMDEAIAITKYGGE